MSGKCARERVLAAFSHVEPDRTPLFEKLIKSPTADLLLGRPCAAVNFTYRMRRLADGDWQDLMDQEAQDLVDLAQVLGLDMISLGTNIPSAEPRPLRIGERAWQVGDLVHEELPSGWIRSQSTAPDSRTAAEVEADLVAGAEAAFGPWTVPDAQLYVFRRAKEIMQDRGLELAVFSSCYGMPVCTLPRQMFEWFVTRPDLLHRYYEKRSQSVINTVTRLIECGADVIGLGGDCASDHGPLISPDDYREFVGMRIREQAGHVHALGALATNASDGDLWPILDEFLIETDVDGFEEIDYAAGVDLARLKAHCGDRITFIGNMDVRFILTQGSPDDVRRATIECLEKGKGNGGHIIMSSNCIHEDVKPENFIAHVEAYWDYFGVKWSLT